MYARRGRADRVQQILISTLRFNYMRFQMSFKYLSIFYYCTFTHIFMLVQRRNTTNSLVSHGGFIFARGGQTRFRSLFFKCYFNVEIQQILISRLRYNKFFSFARRLYFRTGRADPVSEFIFLCDFKVEIQQILISTLR